MSEPRHTLDELQRWMQAVITHPGGISAGIESDEAREQIAVVPEQAERVVNRSRALTAVERLQIYNHAYFARLLECLREEYSVLAAALGNEIFDSFAVAYLQAHPSRSYTLGRLGTRFPDYLEESRPSAVGSHAGEAGWPEFMIDLARLERTVNEVFDGPGAEGEPFLDLASLQAISPDRWLEARLICVPCLRLIELHYPVNDYFTAIRRGEQPAIPEPGAAYVAVTRRDYRVVRYPLEPAQFGLLQALLAGETAGTAIERAAAGSSLDDAELAAALQNWFRFWTAEGFFRGVHIE
jgi:hypothetical protein